MKPLQPQIYKATADTKSLLQPHFAPQSRQRSNTPKPLPSPGLRSVSLQTPISLPRSYAVPSQVYPQSPGNADRLVHSAANFPQSPLNADRQVYSLPATQLIHPQKQVGIVAQASPTTVPHDHGNSLTSCASSPLLASRPQSRSYQAPATKASSPLHSQSRSMQAPATRPSACVAEHESMQRLLSSSKPVGTAVSSPPGGNPSTPVTATSPQSRSRKIQIPVKTSAGLGYVEANVDSSPVLHTRMTPNLDQEFLSASLAQAARDVAKDMETDPVAGSRFALSGNESASGPENTWLSFLDQNPDIAANIGDAAAFGTEAFDRAVTRLAQVCEERGVDPIPSARPAASPEGDEEELLCAPGFDRSPKLMARFSKIQARRERELKELSEQRAASRRMKEDMAIFEQKEVDRLRLEAKQQRVRERIEAKRLHDEEEEQRAEGKRRLAAEALRMAEKERIKKDRMQKQRIETEQKRSSKKMAALDTEARRSEAIKQKIEQKHEQHLERMRAEKARGRDKTSRGTRDTSPTRKNQTDAGTRQEVDQGQGRQDSPMKRGRRNSPVKSRVDSNFRRASPSRANSKTSTAEPSPLLQAERQRAAEAERLEAERLAEEHDRTHKLEERRASAAASSIRINEAEAYGWHRVLDVERTASAEEIKQAFRGLALLHHPDKSIDQSDDIFKKVQASYKQGLRAVQKIPTHAYAQCRPFNRSSEPTPHFTAVQSATV